MMSSLDKLFAPRSIAVIGASRRPGTLGKMFLDAVVKFAYTGKIYPVNPRAEEIDGLKCYPDIKSLPATPDLAVILIPKDNVLNAVEMLGEAGIENIIVISAGFRETGEDGRLAEENLVKLTHKYKMRMIGPNSMGLFNTAPGISLNATFSPTQPLPGHVALISQSGALGVAVLELAIKIQLGFSLFVSTGNKADVGDFDVLAYAATDQNTRVIALYQESIDRPEQFRQLARRLVATKPILVLKAGRTDSGLRAASSHTGALASSDILTDAFFHQCGVLRCETLEELLYSAYALATQPLPVGNRVAIITNAGGPGILASDATERAGLLLSEVQSDTLNAIKNILPPEAGTQNPFDMIASATHETYRAIYQLLENDPNVDILMIIIVKPPVDTTPREIINTLAPLISASGKPVFFVLMADTDEDAGIDTFQNLGVPVFPFPEITARVIANQYRYTLLRNFANKDLPAISTPIIYGDKIRQAAFPAIARKLERYNIAPAPYKIINKPEDGYEFLAKFGSVVLKTADANIIHKSDQGLLYLDINSEQILNESFDDLEQKMRQLSGKGVKPEVLIQQMVKGGIELVLGSKYDPVYGKTIMFGIGGIFVELYRDVVFRVLPINPEDAFDMIDSVKGRRLLYGFRSLPAIDKSILAQTILSFAELISRSSDIIEMDLNPIIWTAEHQLLVVDARMTITE